MFIQPTQIFATSSIVLPANWGLQGEEQTLTGKILRESPGDVSFDGDEVPFKLPRLVGQAATWVRNSKAKTQIIEGLSEKFFPHFITNVSREGVTYLRHPDGHLLEVHAFDRKLLEQEITIVRIGDRCYRFPKEGQFDFESIMSDPLLWMGNSALFEFFSADRFATRPQNGFAKELFWAGAFPTEQTVLPREIDRSMAHIYSEDPYLRLHAHISYVRRRWMENETISLQFLRALNQFGPSYLQQGFRQALGLNYLAPSTWPADWENSLFQLLSTLEHTHGIQNIRVSEPLTSPDEQRIFSARLRFTLQNIPQHQYHPEFIRANLRQGQFFGLPMYVEGDTLVINTRELIGQIKGLRDERRMSQPEYDYILPSTSQMVLDGLTVLAKNNVAQASQDLKRLQTIPAAHAASVARGYQALGHADNDYPELRDAHIGFIRGGFGMGGASQEFQDMINELAERILPLGAKMSVATGFIHQKAVLPEDVDITLLPAVDRGTHYDSVTRHLFDPDISLSSIELQRCYDAAVEDAAHAIADWIMVKGVDVLVGSQMGNPFENPIAMPAIIGAKLLVEAERERLFPVAFRHNYYRDPEGTKPNIGLWQDRHPHLRPDQAGVIHLVDGPANQRIAHQLYGINSMILPHSVRFPNIDPFFGIDWQRTTREDTSGEIGLSQDFATLMHEPRAAFRKNLYERFQIPEDATLLLSPSRLSKQKRLDQAVELMVRLKENLPAGKEIHLLVLGEGNVSKMQTRWSGDYVETLKALEEQITLLGLTGHVHFMGYVSHERTPDNPFTVTDMMRSVDLVVQMSEEESFGATYLEAIASGALVTMANFSYPGFDFGRLFPVHRYVYGGFDVFMRFSQEQGFNDGMMRRMARTLLDQGLRRHTQERNFFRAFYSPYNSHYTQAYMLNLLSAMITMDKA
jgi:glycosyltransferase involved in cell wall biosynthesis